MTDPDGIRFEGGDVFANLEERTITGLLIPYGEIGWTNVGRIQVEAGDVAIPADPSVVGINTDHVRADGVGRATRLWQEPAGIMASFAIARTPEGDAALADAVNPDGKRRRLSAEFGPVVVEAGRLVAGKARLWGAALVERGAFPSAQVLAELAPDEIADVDDTNSTTADLIVETTTTLPESVTVTTADGQTATYTPEAPAPDPAPTNPEGASNVTATATPPAPAAADAQVLATAGAPAAQTTDRPTNVEQQFRQVLAAIAGYRANKDDGARQVLAALSDISPGGATPLPGSGVIQPNWLGHLFQGVPYVREFVTLGKLGTDISLEGKKGFKVQRGTASSPVTGNFDGAWAGSPTEIKSYKGFSTPHTSTRRNFAIAELIGREFRDLPGGEAVLAAFLALIVEDYHVQTDDWALEDWIATAGAPVTPATAKYGTTYPAVVGMVIQGILAVKKRKSDGRRDTPSFAMLNEEGFEELMYAAGGPENLPAFLQIAATTMGVGTVDGNLKVVAGETGITGSASALIGADYAIEFDEIAGGPLHIDALDIAYGRIADATHGYLQTFVVRPEAVVTVGTPANRANSTAYTVGAIVKASSVVYRCTVAGTSDSSAPTAPAVGATVTDGTVTWLRLA